MMRQDADWLHLPAALFTRQMLQRSDPGSLA
jgi:hypothetical protein